MIEIKDEKIKKIIFDNYEIMMSVTKFFSISEYRCYEGDLDTIFEKFKSDMEKHFDKHKQ